MLKNSFAGCPGLFRLSWLLKCVEAWDSPKVYRKSIFWCSRLSKIIGFNVNRQLVYGFLLVINSRPNLGPISHCFWDSATYWLKVANFSYTLSFTAFARGIYRKNFTDSETRDFRAADGEDLVILACNVFDWSTRVTDRRTNGQTDRQNCDG